MRNHHRIEARVGADGCGQLLLDGSDISSAVEGAQISMQANDRTEVSLDLRLIEVTSLDMEGAQVLIDDSAASALIQLGWTPPVDVAELASDEREKVARGYPVLGSWEDGSDIVYLHVQERTDFVIAVGRSTYRDAVEADEVDELLCGRADDYREVSYTPVDPAGGAVVQP